MREQFTPERVARSWHIRFARNWLTFYEGEYHKTRNPVFAWGAIEEALRHDLELPSWVRAYLLESAGGITRLWRDETKKPRKGEIHRAVAGALGFNRRGRSNPFDAIKQHGHEVMMAYHVYQTYKRNRKNYTHAWATVFRDAADWHHQRCVLARCRSSAKTMERYWYKHALTVIPPHLIDRAPSRTIDQILAIE